MDTHLPVHQNDGIHSQGAKQNCAPRRVRLLLSNARRVACRSRQQLLSGFNFSIPIVDWDRFETKAFQTS